MAADQKPFILIDGSSYFFRAYHALPPLSNSKGQPTGAVYGVLNMLGRLLRQYEPTHLAVVFDAKGKTFRDDLYPAYKANRSATPEDLSVQFEPLVKAIEAMGLPLLVIEGVEADDVIGTLATEAARAGMHTIISTGDKDFAQLVNSHITLINTMSNTSMDELGVLEKFGVKPEQVIDYLTLIGDKVDNVPGVTNVGPKTAVKWLNDFGSLDGVTQNADNITGKVGENLRNSLSFLPLSKQLVTIKCDIDLGVHPRDLLRRDIHRDELIAICKEQEFKTMLSDLLTQQSNQTAESITQQYDIISTQQQLDAWITKLHAAKEFSFVLLTHDSNYMSAKIIGVAFSCERNSAAYVPIAHEDLSAQAQLSEQQVWQALTPLLENEHKIKVSHNVKYDMNVLARYGITLRGAAFDTMLQSYVLDSSATRHDLDVLSLKYLSRNRLSLEEIAGKGAKQKPMQHVAIEQLAPYAAQAADFTLQVHRVLWEKLQNFPGLKFVFEKIEMPLVSVLSRMERHGVLIDAVQLQQLSGELAVRLDEIEKQAFAMAGEPFNLSSPKQLQAILFDKLKLPILERTPTGAASTAESVLQELADRYPLPNLILEHRTLSKLKSTYSDKLPLLIDTHTQRVHTSYNQAVASTGRLSSTDPNLQNIPIRNEQGRRIRQAFIAKPGYQIVSADYSQIELRIMAHLTNDPGLTKAFAEGVDVHRATASEVFSTPLDQVSADQRRNAKAINFGLLYGMSAFGLAKQLGIEREAAQLYMTLYFQRYPSVHQYMEDTRRTAHEQGFVETVFGRRLYLPEINASNIMRQRAAERAAINAPLQGSAADIIKLAMLKLDAFLQSANLATHMIMQVHDELVFEVPSERVDEFKKILGDIMCEQRELRVPLEISIGVGDDWDKAH